jgi:hypothetical protein
MKKLCFALLLIALATPVLAKDCEELKAEIAAKLDAKGVKNYTLTVVANDQVKPEEKVVGSCGGGTSKIVYTRAQ